MPRWLLTPSLYNAWRWSLSAGEDEDDQEQARKEMITTLKREQITPNEAMLKGRKFEGDIQAMASGEPLLPLDDPLYENVVAEIAEIVKGGLWQERVYLDMHFRDHGDFLLYGKIDVLKGPWGFDIKYAKNYKIGKYGKSIQHATYMIGAPCSRFAYLISNGREWWREEYFASADDYEEMRGRLADMLDDIRRDPEFSALYSKHWKADRGTG
jgi:hypothetical protein